jgi:hypothetical protein
VRADDQGCNFGTDGTLLFTGSMATPSVVVEDCNALPLVRFQGRAAVSAQFLSDIYLSVATAAQHAQSFYNFNSGRPVFSVNGGIWRSALVDSSADPPPPTRSPISAAIPEEGATPCSRPSIDRLQEQATYWNQPSTSTTALIVPTAL